jgi:hypothetical protein
MHREQTEAGLAEAFSPPGRHYLGSYRLGTTGLWATIPAKLAKMFYSQ